MKKCPIPVEDGRRYYRYIQTIYPVIFRKVCDYLPRIFGKTYEYMLGSMCTPEMGETLKHPFVRKNDAYAR